MIYSSGIMQLLLINARAPRGRRLYITFVAPGAGVCGLGGGSHLCLLTPGCRWYQGCSGAGISPQPLLCTRLLLPAPQGHCPARGVVRGPLLFHLVLTAQQAF